MPPNKVAKCAINSHMLTQHKAQEQSKALYDVEGSQQTGLTNGAGKAQGQLGLTTHSQRGDQRLVTRLL